MNPARKKIYVIHPGYFTDENGRTVFMSHQEIIKKFHLESEECIRCDNLNKKKRDEAIHVYPSRISVNH